MNLKHYLLLRIFCIACLCLLVTACYSLYQSDHQSQQQTRKIAKSLDQQLELELLRIDAGYQRSEKFPDLDLWKQTRNASGICIRYFPNNNQASYSLCQGIDASTASWPKLFEQSYRWFLHPGLEIKRKVTFRGQTYGVIAVTPNADMQLAQAWASTLALIQLSAITILTIALMVFIVIDRSLRPAQIIVADLEKISKGDLTVRLPNFNVIEWQQTGAAINQLTTNQQQLLNQRQQLILKLLTLQEQERRYLARELHDDLSQCLAAIHAITASMEPTARQQCPSLAADINKITTINQQLMAAVRMLLVRLRPAELNDLGLTVQLNNLIAEWNLHTRGKIHFQLQVQSDVSLLADPIPITLFRIIQEGLTNIVKHSSATEANITLTIVAKNIIGLIIEDNGKINRPPQPENFGLGLLGISERVSALAGTTTLTKSQSGGLKISVELPSSEPLWA